MTAGEKVQLPCQIYQVVYKKLHVRVHKLKKALVCNHTNAKLNYGNLALPEVLKELIRLFVQRSIPETDNGRFRRNASSPAPPYGNFGPSNRAPNTTNAGTRYSARRRYTLPLDIN